MRIVIKGFNCCSLLREMLKVACHEVQLNSWYDKHPSSEAISLIMYTYANEAIQRDLATYTQPF